MEEENTWNMPEMTKASFGPQTAIPMSKHISEGRQCSDDD
jgi:hypothetical protein